MKISVLVPLESQRSNAVAGIKKLQSQRREDLETIGKQKQEIALFETKKRNVLERQATLQAKLQKSEKQRTESEKQLTGVRQKLSQEQRKCNRLCNFERQVSAKNKEIMQL